MEAYFYAVLGFCGILMALAVLLSALRMVKEEYADKARKRGGSIRSTEALTTGPQRFWLAYTHSMNGRMITFFTLIVGAFGLVTIALVYFKLTASLHRYTIERAKIMAVNVSDSAPGFMLKKNSSGLRDLLRKQAKRPEVAYIIVQNNANKIFAHSFAALPPVLQTTDSPVEGEHVLQLGEAPVIEVSVPILEGQTGMVRLGLWRNKVEAEISRTVRPLVTVLCAVVVVGVLMAIYLAWKINRPILRLIRTAQKISNGDLEAPSVGTADKTEFGELARALERMRSSIKAALVRLSEQRQP